MVGKIGEWISKSARGQYVHFRKNTSRKIMNAPFLPPFMGWITERNELSRRTTLNWKYMPHGGGNIREMYISFTQHCSSITAGWLCGWWRINYKLVHSRLILRMRNWSDLQWFAVYIQIERLMDGFVFYELSTYAGYLTLEKKFTL